MLKRFVILIVLFLFSGLSLLAQTDDSGLPNDPTVNENANACYEGGTMVGKCNVDFDGDGVVSEAEVTWAWECGWYLIRYEAGMGTVPARCATVVHVPFSICYTDPYGAFAMVGQVNTRDNTVFFDFNDYDCSGQYFLGGPSIVVTGADFAEAYANCDALGIPIFLVRLQDLGYDAPFDYWGCVALL